MYSYTLHCFIKIHAKSDVSTKTSSSHNSHWSKLKDVSASVRVNSNYEFGKKTLLRNANHDQASVDHLPLLDVSI